MTPADRPKKRIGSRVGLLAGAGTLLVLVGALFLPGWFRSARMTRGAIAAYARLVSASNQGDLAQARSLCSARYLRESPPRLAPTGGIVGFPRSIHPNFSAWREGEAVCLCPSNRVGFVYRMVEDAGGWKFDGVVGLLRPGGRVEPAEPLR